MTGDRAAAARSRRAALRLSGARLVLAVLLLAPLALAAPPALAEPHRGRRRGGRLRPRRCHGWPRAPRAAPPRCHRGAGRPARDEFEVDTDGSVIVTEQIRWRFPEGEERHGILRNVKVRAGYRDSETQYRVLRAERRLGHLAVRGPHRHRRSRTSAPSGGSGSAARPRPAARPTTSCGSGSRTSSTTSATAPRSSTTTSSTPRTASRSAGVGDGHGPRAGDQGRCFYGDLGSTTPCEAQAGATSTFTDPDLEAEQGASVLTSYPRDAFGDLTPDLRTGIRRCRLRRRRQPRAARALGWLTIGLAVLLPLLAGPDGAARVSRGRDEQYAGLTPGLTPGSTSRCRSSSVARAPPSRCSSPRHRASSPAWSARSSTRRSTSSTSPPRSSTSPCAATCRSRATTRVSSAPTTGCSPAPRHRPPRAPSPPTSSCSSTRSSSEATASRCRS